MQNTLVHTQQTSDGQIRSTSYRALRAQKHTEEIEKTRLIFEFLEESNDSPLVHRLNDCCTGAWFQRHKETHKLRVRSNRCFIRWCPLCSDARQMFITEQVKEWLRRSKHPKLMTFTIVHSTELLSQQIDKLYEAFQRLRKRKILKSSITGMIWFFQIKKSKADQLWHPHIHALCDGNYIPQTTLSAAWKAVTGDSNVVDIRAVEDIDRSADHVARYAVRPCDLTSLSVVDGCEVVLTLKGRRLLGTSGTAAGISLHPPKQNDSAEWESIGSWSFVYSMLDHDDRAMQIMNAYLLDQPLDDGNSLRGPEKMIIEGFLDQERSPPVQDPTFFDII